MDNNISKNALYKNALPYLIVLPLNEHKLDFWRLNNVGPEVTVHLLSRFLKQDSVEIGINLLPFKNDGEELADQLKDLQNTFQDFSIIGGMLSIGYPLLLLEDAALGSDIAAPLLFWDIEIRNADDDNPAHWILNYEGKNHLRYNEILKNYLIARYALDWDQLMGPTEKLQNRSLLAALERLCEAIKIPNPEAFKLYSCPGKQNPAPFKNGVLWAAVMGEQKLNQANASELPLTLNPRSRRKWFSGIGCLTLNPVQESALNDIFDGNDLVLKGAQNSGKSRTIASFLPALMSDGGSCLLISSELQTHIDLGLFLDKQGLKETGIWFIENESNAVDALLFQLAQLPERVKKLPKFDDKQYNLMLQQFLQLREKLSDRYDAIQKPLLDESDWTNMVGRFMKNHKIDGKQYLSRILDTTDYKWTHVEYYHLAKEIKTSEVLFESVQSLQHPLSRLQDYIFKTKDAEDAETWVNEQVLTFTRLLRDLYRRYTSFIDSYSDDLRFHYESHVKDIKNRVENIQRDLKVYQEVYGNSFDFTDGFTNTRLRILSVFSKKSYQIISAKDQIYKAYEELKDIYTSKKYFEHGMPSISKYLNLSALSKDLKSFETSADEWYARIPKIVRQKVKELTLKLPLKPDFKKRFEALEQQVDVFFSQLQQSTVFKPFDKIKSQKATERETQLRNLLEHLTAVEQQLPNFNAFYRWRKHFLNMEESGRKLVSALVAVRPSSWKTAFNSWYLYHLLEKNFSLQLPDADFPLENYLNLQRELRELISKNALINIREHQAERLKELKKERNFQPANIVANYQDLKLKALVEEMGIDLISDLFPVIVVSPVLADKIFEQKVPLFEVVIIEDAHNLDVKLGRRLSKLGAQRIVLGRENAAGSYLESVSGTVFSKLHQLNTIYSKDGLINKMALPVSTNSRKEFRTELYAYLKDYLSSERLELAPILDEDLEIDILIKPLSESNARIALIADGWLKQVGKYEVERAMHKSKKLKALGYLVYPIWSLKWWRNTETAAEELVTFILNWDKNQK
jgi:hypothetical protein